MAAPTPPISKVLFVSVCAAVVTSAVTTYAIQAFRGPSLAEAIQSTPNAEEGGVIAFPSVVELPSDVAGNEVRNVGLRLVVSGREPSELDEGKVVSQSPLAGSALRAGDAVEVVISSGPAMATVPDVVSKTSAEARAALEALGFVMQLDATAEGDTPDRVISTSPEAGIEAEAGSTVRVRATPSGIPVPELEGTPYRRARQTLEELGLRLGSVRRRYNERLPDLVITSQDPSAGTLVPAGTEVSLQIND